MAGIFTILCRRKGWDFFQDAWFHLVQSNASKMEKKKLKTYLLEAFFSFFWPVTCVIYAILYCYISSLLPLKSGQVSCNYCFCSKKNI